VDPRPRRRHRLVRAGPPPRRRQPNTPHWRSPNASPKSGAAPSVGSVGDALPESEIGLFKTELIRRRGRWKGLGDVELATISQAQRYVDQALELAPANQEALWFRANIELYGRSDPAAALAVLAQLQQRDDLEATVRAQVADLVAVARERLEAGG